MERRLAAILAADVVGYSRLVGADEERTLRMLSGYRQVIDGLVAAHRGRIFGSAGDSVMPSSQALSRLSVVRRSSSKSRGNGTPMFPRIGASSPASASTSAT